MTRWITSLSQKLGWHTTIIMTLIIIAACVSIIWAQTRPSSIVADSRKYIFICSETGKAFTGTLEIGESPILMSPYSGKRTGYPAELCYWTADGQVRKEPFPVLMNEQVGKIGPTFCPDCGRLVVLHNPVPEPGKMPPLTREKYEQKYAKTKAQP